MSMPPTAYPRFFMPLTANIPKEYIVHRDLFVTVLAVPGWGTGPKTTYYVEMDNITREVICDKDCPGFASHHNCHHVRGIIWLCNKPAKKKGIHKHSIESYYKFTPEQLNERRRVVFYTVKANAPLTDKDIARILGWSINRVTPRRGELRDQGLIAEFGSRYDEKTSRHESLWVTAWEPVLEEAHA